MGIVLQEEIERLESKH